MEITFITGNQGKAERFERALGLEVKHQAVDVYEIQSLDLRRVVEHKAKAAFEIVKSPVVIDDTALVFEAWNSLPGPFIKWFLESMSLSDLCSMLESDRRAYSHVMFGYYDGTELALFERKIPGTIPLTPRGDGGFGWDQIFIADGSQKTHAEMTPEEEFAAYAARKPFDLLRDFLLQQAESGNR